MLSWIFRALRLGGVLTSPQATPSGLQMTPPSLPGTENPRNPGSPDFILIMHVYSARHTLNGGGSVDIFTSQKRSENDYRIQ